MTSPEQMRPGTSRAGHSVDAGGDAALVRNIAGAVRPWDGTGDDVLELVGDAHYVLIGEASHGTQEFYATRAEITKRLIREKAFSAVAVEADWPDAYRVNRYVRRATDDPDAEHALRGFRRFPQWMWRNTVVVEFVDWLRTWNGQDGVRRPTGFYGLDLYSLHASMAAVIGYLDTVDPEAAGRARQRYACFDHFGDDAQRYGYSASFGDIEPCEDAVVSQLVELQRHAAEFQAADGREASDAFFYAEQNARLARNAEAYYRSMFRGRADSWNLRDRHMAETLGELTAFLGRDQTDTRVVVWAHNSHLGDARATEMGTSHGELNLGQLVRERARSDSVSIGFSTYAGTVTAASDWGEAAERKRVRPGLPGSWEELLHEVVQATGDAACLLPLRDPALADLLAQPRLERAIGVIYRPDTERSSHYFRADLPRQFDAMIHIDRTGALTPLERTAAWEAGEVPETYPTAV